MTLIGGSTENDGPDIDRPPEGTWTSALLLTTAV